jgi:hypothetical protein
MSSWPAQVGQTKALHSRKLLKSFRWTSAWRHDLGRGQDFDSFRAAHGAIPVADGPAPSADVLSWRVGVGRVLVLNADAAIIETAGGSRLTCRRRRGAELRPRSASPQRTRQRPPGPHRQRA